MEWIERAKMREPAAYHDERCRVNGCRSKNICRACLVEGATRVDRDADKLQVAANLYESVSGFVEDDVEARLDAAPHLDRRRMTKLTSAFV